MSYILVSLIYFAMVWQQRGVSASRTFSKLKMKNSNKTEKERDKNTHISNRIELNETNTGSYQIVINILNV